MKTSILAMQYWQRIGPLDWDIEVSDVMKKEVNEFLISFLAQEIDEGLRWQLLSEFIGSQAIFSKGVIEFIEDYVQTRLELAHKQCRRH